MIEPKKYLATLAAFAVFALPAGTTAAAVTPAQKCASSKMKASGKGWSAEAKCWAVAIAKEEAVDSECLSKATGKLAAAFTKIESKGGCLTSGDAATILGKIGASIDDVSSDLSGGGRCGGSKMKAAGKAWSSKAKCHAKALAAGADADTACLDKAANKYDGAFSKLDAGGGCAVTGDGPAIHAKIDVNVDDILGDLGCGNGNREGDEECDFAGQTAGCDANCTFASCGDGTLNTAASETCDDGNLDDTDGCTVSCVIAAPCTASSYPTIPYPAMPATKFTVNAATGHCYIGASQTGDWFNHADECVAAGGTLAVPNTDIENTYIGSCRAGGAITSLGVQDILVEGDFVSLTDESFTPNWAGGEPNNFGNEDCVIMYPNTQWADLACAAMRDEFVCEIAP